MMTTSSNPFSFKVFLVRRIASFLSSCERCCASPLLPWTRIPVTPPFGSQRDERRSIESIKDDRPLPAGGCVPESRVHRTPRSRRRRERLGRIHQKAEECCWGPWRVGCDPQSPKWPILIAPVVSLTSLIAIDIVRRAQVRRPAGPSAGH